MRDPFTKPPHPDARRLRDARPARLRLLVRGMGMSVPEVAERIGVSTRSLERYLSDATPEGQWAPYPVQYTLERLAKARDRVLAARDARAQAAKGRASLAGKPVKSD